MFQQVFALEQMSRDSRHRFKAETWIKNMLPKGPSKKINFLESTKIFKMKVVTVDPSLVSPRRKKPKYISSYVDCPKFSSYLENTCSESMPRRRLAAMYLAVWLSEVIFRISGKKVHTGCIYLACKMAFWNEVCSGSGFGQLFLHKIKDDRLPCVLCQAI